MLLHTNFKLLLLNFELLTNLPESTKIINTPHHLEKIQTDSPIFAIPII